MGLTPIASTNLIMELTETLKKQIDDSSYETLLRQWRLSPIGSAIFQGESGEYFTNIMMQKKNELPDNGVAASKTIGWE